MSNFTKLMAQAAAGVGGGDFYDYTIDNSVFTGDGTKYIYHTGALASTPTDRKKLSISFWFKKSNFYSETSQTDYFYQGMSTGYPSVGIFEYSSGDKLEITNYRPSPEPRYLMHTDTDMAFRDVSAWYHMFLVVDTTLSTATDRYRIYINGSEITHTWRNQSSYTPQNVEFHYFNLAKYAIGSYINPNTGAYDPRGNGYYLAEYHAVDGTAYAPTDFGEFKNGVWIPKETSGISYGNGGFYLDFADSSDLGKDVSGNANHFSTSSMSSSDQKIDTPTNNFMNARILVPRYVQSTNYRALNGEGNTQTIHYNSSAGLGPGLPESGKWYFETTCENSYPDGGYRTYAGVATNTPSSTVESAGGDSDDNLAYQFYDAGTTGRFNSTSLGGWVNSGSAGSGSLNNGDIVGFAVDMDNGIVTTYVNNVQDVSITWASSAFSRKDVRIVSGGAGTPSYSQNTVQDWNFGQNGTFNGYKTAQGNSDENGYGDFYYTPPSGYLAVCSQNMPELTIGPNSDTTSDENFNTVLYTGDGSTTRTITGFGFDPDLVWHKARQATIHHNLIDRLRGAGNNLSSSGTFVEYGGGTNGAMNSVETDGASILVGSSSANNVNQNGLTYVLWGWKANGSGITNNDGTLTATVSANQDAGISIITAGYGNGTFGHGLGRRPDVMIWKERSPNTNNWFIVHPGLSSANHYVLLNSNAAETTTGSNIFGLTTTTAGMDNGLTGRTGVAYCFAEVEGFSKFGKYTGNGISDGPFIYTGFRPAFVMVKRTNSTGNWLIQNSKALGYNPSNSELYANLTNTETTADRADFLSNGFKVRINSTENNALGSTYIYMAFAENPFKYANAR